MNVGTILQLLKLTEVSQHIILMNASLCFMTMKLSEVHPFHTFRPHPFKVRDDAKMQEIAASIRVNGVMVPGLARPEKDGNGYEIVAGHRRTHGSELAGLEEMPFIVREMTDHEAVQAMNDSNKQRDGMLPSELAALLELEVEDIKHQGGRLKGVAEGDEMCIRDSSISCFSFKIRKICGNEKI